MEVIRYKKLDDELWVSFLCLKVPVVPACEANMCSELEKAMESLIMVFHKYSSKEGDRYKLNKKELKCLFQEELSDFLKASKDPDAVGTIMKDLDINEDGEVDFQEYVVLVAALTVACNKFFHEALESKHDS
ncbi:protein S100-A1 [Arapaima gigas]